MKKVLVLAIVSLSMCCVALGKSSQPAAANTELTVNQYFLQIPDEYIQADTRKRAGWIDADDNANGYLDFTVPFGELPEEAGTDATSFGSIQVFKKNKGGAIIGLAVNMCVDKVCEGQLLFLDYNNGKWENVTEEMAVSVDYDEIREILNDSPAFEKLLHDDDEVPLAIEFSRHDKMVQFVADCKKTCDGGVIAKMFKWNGSGFEEYEEVLGL